MVTLIAASFHWCYSSSDYSAARVGKAERHNPCSAIFSSLNPADLIKGMLRAFGILAFNHGKGGDDGQMPIKPFDSRGSSASRGSVEKQWAYPKASNNNSNNPFQKAVQQPMRQTRQQFRRGSTQYNNARFVPGNDYNRAMNPFSNQYRYESSQSRSPPRH